MQAEGVEQITLLEIKWGDNPGWDDYSDRAIVAEGSAAAILQADLVSTSGKIGTAGVTKSASIVLDDTDGSLKTIYDTKVIEGSECKIYMYLTGSVSPAEKTLLLDGHITGDILWSEGERTLSFAVEQGVQSKNSSEVGYAPDEGAFSGMNPEAVGNNWPLVFGVGLKVPAARIEHPEEISLSTRPSIDYSDATYDFDNGSTLPQTPTVITVTMDDIIFTGTMSGDTFTPATKNDAKYTSVALGARPSIDPDQGNPAVCWVASAANVVLKHYCIVNYPGKGWMVNYCTAQEGTKCWFATSWMDNVVLNSSQTFDEVAKYPRTSWNATYETLYDGDYTMLYVPKDGWIIRQGVPVRYNTGAAYEDRYVANLIPSSAVHEVWGTREYFGKTIWAKIPSSYYTITLDDPITTDPGAVVRHPTTLKFATSLQNIDCENWTGDVYVSQTSTVNYAVDDIIEYIVTNFTTFGWNSGSDTPPFRADFAYFETTDAWDLIEQIAWQAACAVYVNDSGEVTLQYLPQSPGGGVNVTDTSEVVMRSLELVSRPIEDINTRFIAQYVSDYSGEDDVSHEYVTKNNEDEFGVHEETFNFFIFTCANAVEAVADFWAYRRSHSWQQIKYDGFYDLIDYKVFEVIKHSLSPHVVNIHGQNETINFDTTRGVINITAELAMKVGESTEDTDYWAISYTPCPDPTSGLSQLDYTVPIDDSCPSYLTVHTQNREVYYVKITYAPALWRRWTWYTITAEIVDDNDNLVAINTNAKFIVTTTDLTDNYYNIDVTFAAGQMSQNVMVRGGHIFGNIHIWIRPADRRIRGARTKDTRMKR